MPLTEPALAKAAQNRYINAQLAIAIYNLSGKSDDGTIFVDNYKKDLVGVVKMLREEFYGDTHIYSFEFELFT